MYTRYRAFNEKLRTNPCLGVVEARLQQPRGAERSICLLRKDADDHSCPARSLTAARALRRLTHGAWHPIDAAARSAVTIKAAKKAIHRSLSPLQSWARPSFIPSGFTTTVQPRRSTPSRDDDRHVARCSSEPTRARVFAENGRRLRMLVVRFGKIKRRESSTPDRREGPSCLVTSREENYRT